MAAPYNDLLSKVEAAYKALLDALALKGTRGTTTNVDVNFLAGLDDEAVTMPKGVCQAEEASEEVFYGLGILRLSVHLHLYSHSGDETLATHRARVAAVADAVMTDDRAAALKTAATAAGVTDFYCYDVQWLGVSADPAGNSFHTAIDLSVVCCAANL